MTAYKQSRSICNKLFEAGEAGLSVKDLFVAEAASASSAFDHDSIFSLDIILTRVASAGYFGWPGGHRQG